MFVCSLQALATSLAIQITAATPLGFMGSAGSPTSSQRGRERVKPPTLLVTGCSQKLSMGAERNLVMFGPCFFHGFVSKCKQRGTLLGVLGRFMLARDFY